MLVNLKSYSRIELITVIKMNADDKRTIDELKNNPAVLAFLMEAVKVHRKFGNCTIQVCHGECHKQGWHHLDYQMDFVLVKPSAVEMEAEVVTERLAITE
jgi:hypothetical protein